MEILSIGVEHRTCPLDAREKLALTADEAYRRLVSLSHQSAHSEAVLLSTCARTELYLVGPDADAVLEMGRRLLLSLSRESEPYLRVVSGADAVRHAFRVASGLESQVIGELEIGAQVRAAVHMAERAGTIGPALSSLFRAATACARRLRRETDLGSGNGSVAGSVTRLYEQHGPLQDARVLIVGGGTIARLLAQALAGASSLTIASRTPESARRIAERWQGQAMDLNEALLHVGTYDLVCLATNSPRPLVLPDMVVGANGLVIFDLSIPRNVDPSVAAAAGVHVYDVDSVSDPSAARNTSLTKVDSILEAEVRDFVGRQAIRRVGPIIEALRQHVDSVREAELERIASQLDRMAPADRRTLELLTSRLIDRMFHHLVVRLRLAALSDPELIRAAEFFFAHGDQALFPTSEPEPHELFPALRD